jgi:hypothetical protein
MSGDPQSKFIPNPSQGDYWGGYMVDSWVYKFLAFFPITGFLGIDHLVLRSPFTALIKLLVNIFFWGAWYFYDLLQIFMDNTFVANYGMSTPYGPRGHGYKFFKDLTENNLNEFGEASPYNGGLVSNVLFMLYMMMTITIGFTGLPMMLAGDFNGGLIKMFSNFLFLPFLFYLVGQVFDYFNAGSIQKNGIVHPWPMYPMLTIFEKYPAVNLIGTDQATKELKEHTAKYDPLVKSGKLPLIPEMAMNLFSKVYEAANNIPVVAAFNTVAAAKGAALATSDMAQTVAKVGQKLATAVEQKISKNPDAIIDKVLGSTVDIDIQNPMLKQKGGALDMASPGYDNVMMAGIGLLIFGGFLTAIVRKYSVPRREGEDEYPRKTYERNDAPPIPGRT